MTNVKYVKCLYKIQMVCSSKDEVRYLVGCIIYALNNYYSGFLQDLITTFKDDPTVDGDFWIGLSWDNSSSSYTWHDEGNTTYR